MQANFLCVQQTTIPIFAFPLVRLVLFWGFFRKSICFLLSPYSFFCYSFSFSTFPFFSFSFLRSSSSLRFCSSANLTNLSCSNSFLIQIMILYIRILFYYNRIFCTHYFMRNFIHYLLCLLTLSLRNKDFKFIQ